MNDFDWDVLQKKRIAQQAKYRKNGSKSRKCSLPSDGMSRKQWLERCGDMVSVSLNKPMSWDDFKELSPKMQTWYLEALRDKYGATATSISTDVFGMSRAALGVLMKRKGLDVEFPKGQKMSRKQEAEWEKFIAQEEATEPEEAVAEVEPIGGNETVQVAGFERELQQVNEKEQMKLGLIKLEFSGGLDISQVHNSLKMILGDGRKGKLTVVWEEDVS